MCLVHSKRSFRFMFLKDYLGIDDNEHNALSTQHKIFPLISKISTIFR
jgi:hypothetical protein